MVKGAIFTLLFSFATYVGAAQNKDTISVDVPAQDVDSGSVEKSGEEIKNVNLSEIDNDKPTDITTDTSGITDLGVAVSPSSMRFRVNPGKSEKQYVTITNDTYKNYKFKLTFSDVLLNSNGSVEQVPIGASADKFGLTRWITAAPNYVDLKPGEKIKIEIIVKIPNEPDAYKAAWCLLMIDEANEKKYLLPEDASKSNVAMGVLPTFGFGVYIFQNPPNVAISKVEIESFTVNYDDENKYVYLKAKNVGDGIAYCKSYIEITNLKTGQNERIGLKPFNVMPESFREFNYAFPGKFEKGKYSIMAVLDFGSEEELEAAEIDLNIE